MARAARGPAWVDSEVGTKNIAVNIIQDSKIESDETFTVTLSGISGSESLGTSAATVTILDDDLSADLSITKSNHQVGVTVGSSITYTIVVSNAGPNDVMGATVADTLPADLTCIWTCAASGRASCTASPGSGDLTETVGIPTSDSVTYAAECDVDAGASGTLQNTATVTARGGVTDADLGNNSATDSDALSSDPPLAVELFGEKTGTETVEAQRANTVENLTVKAGAVLSQRAGSNVILGDGVIVEEGAELIIDIDATLIP